MKNELKMHRWASSVYLKTVQTTMCDETKLTGPAVKCFGSRVFHKQTRRLHTSNMQQARRRRRRLHSVYSWVTY